MTSVGGTIPRADTGIHPSDLLMLSEAFREKVRSAFQWLQDAGFVLTQQEPGYCRYQLGSTTVEVVLERREVWVQVSFAGEPRRFGIAEFAAVAGNGSDASSFRYIRTEAEMHDAITDLSARFRSYRHLLDVSSESLLPRLRVAFDAQQGQA